MVTKKYSPGTRSLGSTDGTSPLAAGAEQHRHGNAAHHRRGNTAGRRGEAAGEHAQPPFLRNSLGCPLGKKMAEARQGYGGTGTAPVRQRLIEAQSAEEHPRHHVAREDAGGGQLGPVDEDLPHGAEDAAAEERVISELQALGKPFVILLNCVMPESAEAQALAAEMEARYHAPVIAVSCLSLDEETIRTILSRLLDMFPIREISVETAGWLPALRSGHWLKTAVFDAVRQAAQGLSVMQDVRALPEQLRECEYIQECAVRQIELGTGNVILRLALDPALFYRVLGEETGIEIQGENELFPVLLELAQIRREYERVRPALEEAEATGYGIIMPEAEELTLEEPEMIRQGGRYGVRLRASAPSLHIMKAGIQTTVSPIVGSEKQSEELVLYLLREFEENPAQIWESNIFGKSLHELVNEGLHTKLSKMPPEARLKLQETLERVINEGCSGLICFIL